MQVNDFGSSWRDGTAFIAIVNCIQPNAIDVNAYRNAPNRVRLEAAFQAAETQLGIARLLDPEDLDVSKPDDKSIMTYVAQFLRSYPDVDGARKAGGVSGGKRADEDDAPKRMHQELVAWINDKNSLMDQLQGGRGAGDNVQYQDYQQLRSEFDMRLATLEQLRSLVASNSVAGVTAPAWHQVELSWQRLETQLRHWQWTLDTGLAGALGQAGEWLHNAEHLLCSEDVPMTFDDEAANGLKIKLDEHKQFFAELDQMKDNFEHAAAAAAASAQVPADQLRDMATRFQSLGDRASQRACRLRFLEHKCCILAFLDLTDAKLKAWSVRYGAQETICHMLDQYRAFVSRNKVNVKFQRV